MRCWSASHPSTFPNSTAGDADYAIKKAHESQPPPPLHARVPSVSAEVEAVVLRALEKKRTDRYASSREFREALAAAMVAPPPAPPPPPPHSRGGATSVFETPRPQMGGRASFGQQYQVPAPSVGSFTSIMSRPPDGILAQAGAMETVPVKKGFFKT